MYVYTQLLIVDLNPSERLIELNTLVELNTLLCTYIFLSRMSQVPGIGLKYVKASSCHFHRIVIGNCSNLWLGNWILLKRTGSFGHWHHAHTRLRQPINEMN